jgi:hypothetical protein
MLICFQNLSIIPKLKASHCSEAEGGVCGLIFYKLALVIETMRIPQKEVPWILG